MQKLNIKDVAPDQSMNRYFTGRVEVRKMITEAVNKDAEAFLVSFFDGARTKLHYHETDQILIATEGKGAIALQAGVEEQADGAGGTIRMGEVQNLSPGDFVCVPAFLWHWHGAARGADFAHFQVKRPGKTIWAE